MPPSITLMVEPSTFFSATLEVPVATTPAVSVPAASMVNITLEHAISVPFERLAISSAVQVSVY